MNKKQFFIVSTFILFIVLVIFGVAWYKIQNSSPTVIEQITQPFVSKNYRFIFMGDTGAASEGQFKVADAIQKHCDEMKDCHSVWILGDVIYEEGVESINDSQFQTKFEEPYKNIQLPFYILYGNHDYIGCEECYIAYSKKSTKWRMPARYYKQSIDNVISLYGIDTERFDHDEHEWLEDNLATDSAQWKLVLGHRPIRTAEETKVKENWNGKDQLKESICTIAQFYIAGHAHIMEDQGPLEDCSVHQLVSGGGGAYVRTVLESAAGEFSIADNGFLSIKVNNRELVYTFYDDDGQKLFEKKLTN